jgi:DNA uptake protein ComE-like DNA-binding protein
MTPYKFPDWVKREMIHTQFIKIVKHSREKVVKDINSATQEDLMKVYGIGQVLSERI